MANTLSRKPRDILASLTLEGWKRATTFVGYDLQYYEDESVALVCNVTTILNLLQHAKKTQWYDVKLREIWNRLQKGE